MTAERVLWVLGTIGATAVVVFLALAITHALGLGDTASAFGAGVGGGWFLRGQTKDWPR